MVDNLTSMRRQTLRPVALSADAKIIRWDKTESAMVIENSMEEYIDSGKALGRWFSIHF